MHSVEGLEGPSEGLSMYLRLPCTYSSKWLDATQGTLEKSAKGSQFLGSRCGPAWAGRIETEDPAGMKDSWAMLQRFCVADTKSLVCMATWSPPKSPRRSLVCRQST